MQETTAALASPTPKLRQKSLVGNKIYGILEVNHQRTWKRTKKLLPFPTTTLLVLDPLCYKPWNSISSWTFHLLAVFQEFYIFRILQRNQTLIFAIDIYTHFFPPFALWWSHAFMTVWKIFANAKSWKKMQEFRFDRNKKLSKYYLQPTSVLQSFTTHSSSLLHKSLFWRQVSGLQRLKS